MAGWKLAVLAKSCILYGPLVKRLRHGPFTAVTWVRFPYGSYKSPSAQAEGLLYASVRGIEQGGAPQRATNSPVDCWLARGRFPVRVTYGGQHFAAGSRPRPTMQDIRHINHKQTARAPFCGGRKRPPYRVGRTRSLPKNAKYRTVLQAAYMRPLRMDRTQSQYENGIIEANGHGGVKISALRAAFGGCAPRRACGRSPALQGKQKAGQTAPCFSLFYSSMPHSFTSVRYPSSSNVYNA